MRKVTKDKDLYEWHEWFAWYPIWVSTGHLTGVWVFWEKVQRRRVMSYAGVDTHIRNLDGTRMK